MILVENVTRYRCSHCRKSYSRRGTCAKHEVRCFRDPLNRCCTTCIHFTKGGLGDYGDWLPNFCDIDRLYVEDIHGPGLVERHPVEWVNGCDFHRAREKRL